MRRGNWSAPELMKLRELFPGNPPERVARRLDRSVASVLRRARRMFAAGRRTGPWTETDDGVLRLATGVHDVDTMALLVSRPPEDVISRLQEFRARPRTGEWSASEVSLLKRLYGTRKTADLALALSRTEDDVQARALALCLAKDKAAGIGDGVRMPRWDAKSLARLRELYPVRENLEIARVLGRSVSSVANKASQLGLSKGRSALRQIGQRNVRQRWR